MSDRDIIDVPAGNVRMEKRRCYGCGRWWAYETFAFDSPECPVCGGKENVRLRSQIATHDKTVAALKGAITRARRAKGRR